uniref:Uncharacterized protein n=1 Tax=Anguilla anguilla TaxID=7936 RepID=A0A0E9WQH0_ANGAN
MYKFSHYRGNAYKQVPAYCSKQITEMWQMPTSNIMTIIHHSESFQT